MFSVNTWCRSTLIRALWIGLLWVISTHPAYASIGSAPCTNAVTLELNGDTRSVGADDIDFFDVDVPTMGYLTVQVVAPFDAAAKPKLAFLDDDCRLGVHSARNRRILSTFATGFVIEILEPGAHRFAVAARDPRLKMGMYKVVTAFMSHTDIARFSRHKSTEDPDPELDPMGSPSTEDPDPELDPMGYKSTVGLGSDIDLLGTSLCRPDGIDDHSDMFLCASTLVLGESRRGQLANSWNDDRDVFTFLLAEWQTVKIEGSGDTETLGTLYDTHGLRLSVDDTDPGAGFRIVTTLAPGRYFVGIEGPSSAPGEYALSLKTLMWPSSE